MPYYVFNRRHTTPEAIREFMKARQWSGEYVPHTVALRDVKEAYKHKSPSAEIVYVADALERTQWRERESKLFETGEYVRVPWHRHDEYPDHFVHRSVKTPGLVAYTPTDLAGQENKQVAIKPGRYLERYYRHIALATRQAWIADCVADTMILRFAVTADEIERVYRGRDYDQPSEGPDGETIEHYPFVSCMGPDGHADFDGEHPVRVYGDSDLQCAYMGPIDAVIARCLVWPKQKIYARVYGSESIRYLLERAGFSHGHIIGARVRAIEYDSHTWVFPYCDGGVSGATYLGNGWIKLGADGEIATDSTNGYSGKRSRDTDDDEPEYPYTCDHCGEGHDNEDSGYCQSCESDRSYCEYGDHDTWDEMYEYLTDAGDTDHMCSDCTYEVSRFTCEGCGSRTREYRYSIETQRRRRDDGVARRVCENCVQRGVVICATCNVPYRPDDEDQAKEHAHDTTESETDTEDTESAEDTAETTDTTESTQPLTGETYTGEYAYMAIDTSDTESEEV